MPHPPHEELWREALTLGELIVKLVREKKTRSPEFQSILKYYGKDKIRILYDLEIEKQKGHG